MKAEWGAARREEMVRKEQMLTEQRRKEATNSRWGLSFPGVLIAQEIPSHLPRITIQSALLRGSLLHFHLSEEPPTHPPLINQIRCTVDVPWNKGRLLLFHPALAHGRYLLLSSTQCGEQTVSGVFKVSFRCLSEPHQTHFCRDGARQVCNDGWRQSVTLSGAELASLPSSWKTRMELGLTPHSLDSLLSGEEWAGFLEHCSALGPLC